MFPTFQANSESPKRSKARSRRNQCASNANSGARTIAPKASASGRRWADSQFSATRRPSAPCARRATSGAGNRLVERRMI